MKIPIASVQIVVGIVLGAILGSTALALGHQALELPHGIPSLMGSALGVLGAFGAVWYSQWRRERIELARAAELIRVPLRQSIQSLFQAEEFINEIIEEQVTEDSEVENYKNAIRELITGAKLALSTAKNRTTLVPKTHHALEDKIRIIELIDFWLDRPSNDFLMIHHLLRNARESLAREADFVDAVL